MNGRQRINGSIAERAALPLGIKDRRAALLGKYQNFLVSD
jgi:hypothetical protein